MYRNLDAEMKRIGLTRGNLAKEMSLAPSTMSLKLNGKSDITLREAVKIKRILNVDIPLETLFDENKEEVV